MYDTPTFNSNYQSKFKEYILILALNFTQITNQNSRGQQKKLPKGTN